MFNVPHNAPPGLMKFLTGLQNVQEDGGGWNAKCPQHDDGKNSLSISVSDAGKAVWHCHAGCDPKAIIYATGVTMREMFPDHGEKKSTTPRGRIVTTYDYQDADGNLVFQVCRMEPKDFRQRKPDGRGGWTWKTKGVNKVLYRLPELKTADADEFVFVAEGEKDVDNLWQIGCVATTNAGGADITGSKWLKKYNGALVGRHVVLLPDNDDVGRGHAATVASQLKETAASVRILELPGLASKGDISDWIAAGGTKEKLIQLAAAVGLDDLPKPPSEIKREEAKAAGENPTDPAATHYEKKITDALEIDVLGYIEGGKVKIWSRFHRKSEIVDVEKLTYTTLLRLCGPVVKAKVAAGGQAVGDENTVAEVKSAISLLAGYRKIDDETEVGQGCWEGLDEHGHPTTAVIAVGAKEAAVLNGVPGLQRMTSPQYGGRTMDLSDGAPWFDFNRIASLMDGYSRDWAVSVVDQVEELFGRWVWTNQTVVPSVLTGCVLASWVQTLWKWRPQIAVIGESKTGKSTLFEALGGGENALGIFGRLVIKSSQSSAAGIRQRLQRSATIALCDEFDTTKEKTEILEMIRSASRGDSTLRGTSGKQKGVGFVLRHMIWLAGITVDLKRAPDKNRFIMLELLPPAESDRGKLVLPSSDELAGMGEKLLVIAMRKVFAAKQIAAELRTTRITGVDDRIIESYSVPASMLAAVHEISINEARVILGRMVEETRESQQQQSDQEILTEEILSARVQVQGGKFYSVAQILNESTDDRDFEAMETHGVSVCFDRRGRKDLAEGYSEKLLFIAHRLTQRHLLRGSQWETQALDQIMKRIPGAILSRRRVAGSRQHGITIPWDWVTKFGIKEHTHEGLASEEF